MYDRYAPYIQINVVVCGFRSSVYLGMLSVSVFWRKFLFENFLVKLWRPWYVRYAARNLQSDEMQESYHIFIAWKFTLKMLIVLSAVLWSLFFAGNSLQALPYVHSLADCDNVVLFVYNLCSYISFHFSYAKFERSRGGTSAEDVTAMPQRATLAWWQKYKFVKIIRT